MNINIFGLNIRPDYNEKSNYIRATLEVRPIEQIFQGDKIPYYVIPAIEHFAGIASCKVGINIIVDDEEVRLTSYNQIINDELKFCGYYPQNLETELIKFDLLFPANADDDKIASAIKQMEDIDFQSYLDMVALEGMDAAEMRDYVSCDEFTY